MKEQIIAKRYAEAFLSGLAPAVGVKQAVEELKSLKFILRKNPDFQELLESLQIIYSEKCNFIDTVLKDFSAETRFFLKLVLEKGRIKNIIDICDYARTNYSHEAVDALLKTSYPLDLDLIQTIKERLENKFKKRLNLHLQLDADLMGGIEVTVGNTVIDGSVKGRLDELREKLITVRIN